MYDSFGGLRYSKRPSGRRHIFYAFQFKPFTNPSRSMLSNFASHVGRGTPVRPLFCSFIVSFVSHSLVSSTGRRRWYQSLRSGSHAKHTSSPVSIPSPSAAAGSGLPYLLNASNSPERKHAQGAIVGKNQCRISHHECSVPSSFFHLIDTYPDLSPDRLPDQPPGPGT